MVNCISAFLCFICFFLPITCNSSSIETVTVDVTMGYENGYYGDSIDDSESLFDDMLVFINGNFIGEMVDTVNITLNVDPTIENRISLIGRVSSFGEVTLTEESYQTNSVYIPLNENHGYAEWANMSVSSITENMIDKNFSSFDISFSHNKLPIDIDENPSFIINLARADGREINLEKQSSVDISHYFHVVDGILTPKSFEEFKSFFSSRAIFGELTLMVSARGKKVDVDYFGEVNFYLDTYRLDGKLTAPTSNSNVAVGNVEITFSYFLNRKKLFKKVVTDEYGFFSIKLPHANLSFLAKNFYENTEYILKGEISAEQSRSNINFNLMTAGDKNVKASNYPKGKIVIKKPSIYEPSYYHLLNSNRRSHFIDACRMKNHDHGYIFKCVDIIQP